MPPVVEAWSPIHWTTTEVPGRKHVGADSAKAAWVAAREGLERQMEGQVGAVQEERPNKDV